MKRRYLTVAVLFCCLGVGLLARADLRFLSGIQLGSVANVKGPVLVRTVTATDAPAVDPTSATWTGALSTCTAFPPNYGSLVSLSVLALDATDDPALGQVAWKLWLVPKYGPMTLAAYGTWAMGTLEVSHNPETGIAIGTDVVLDDDDATHYAWGELPVITNQYWTYPVIDSGTTNDVGRLTFKRGNAVGFKLEITDFAVASTIDELHIFIEEPRVN